MYENTCIPRINKNNTTFKTIFFILAAFILPGFPILVSKQYKPYPTKNDIIIVPLEGWL